MDMTWIQGGLLGFVKDGERMEAGAMLALRKNGDEFLFGSREEGKACRWLLVTEFFVDPLAMAELEEVDDDEPAEEPQPTGPFGGVRRRGG
jgi:hypothetical protein